MIQRGNPTFFTTLTWIVLWATLLITFVIFLPGFSEFDTSKYLTIAQHMMNQHNYLLAYWQGELYSDKPPLLFWLIIAGWRMFGISNWWPQLIVLALATASMVVSQRLARCLWPQDHYCARITPFILIGCFHWVWFAKEIRVDGILVLATLLSLYSIIRSIQGNKKYWLLYIAAIGLGGFAKGPVILVFILFPAIFLPSLLSTQNSFSPKWYGLLGLATILGMCIPLVWAIPAALSAGKVFTQEIFYQQITARATQHRESLLFYLLRMPLWLLPWSIYPPVWQSLCALKIFSRPSGETVCLMIVVVGLVVFSVFGQKLPHYLYPLFPIFAILIARLCSLHSRFDWRDQWPMAGLLLALGVFCLFYPFVCQWLSINTFVRGYFLQEINLKLWGSIFLLTGIWLFTHHTSTQLAQLIGIATASVVVALFVNSIMLSKYQQHLTSDVLYNTLQHINPTALVVVEADHIEDEKVQSWIKQHSIPTISAAHTIQWKKNHPHGYILTTQLGDLKEQYPIAWFYQARFSIVALQHY